MANGPLEQPALPLILTIEGHAGPGFDNRFIGPAYDTARALEIQNVCQVQPVGYDNFAIPFNNNSGIRETIRLLNERVTPFPTRKFGVCANSQGAIVWCRTYLEHILPANGQLHHLLPRLRRAAMFGNPCREKGTVRPGQPNPPPPNTRGIADVRIAGTPSFWWEFVHNGDIFAAVPDDDTGEHMTAIYEIVQGNWFGGPNAIVAQILEIFTNPGPEIWSALVAIYLGIAFAANQSPHGGFDIRPAIEHMRGVAL